MSAQPQRPDLDRILGGLKDFQRQSVEHVFRRMYLDSDATRRFLLADEVGLGKTMVARGLIARVVDHLWDKVERIDIIYICSNGDIARQNANRLNIFSAKGMTEEQRLRANQLARATRITLLPIEMKTFDRKVNFISFTPSTSFDLKSSLGMQMERVLIFKMLEKHWRLSGAAPTNVLRGFSGAEGFRAAIRDFSRDIEPGLQQAFLRNVDGQTQLHDRFRKLCDAFARANADVTDEEKEERSAVVGELRSLLARTCLHSLEPDLIILDEFQRFKHLLEGGDPASELAKDLFNYEDERTKARTLLVSATPYKMYTVSDERERDDHYADFLRTLTFLVNDEQRSGHFERLLTEFRFELLSGASKNRARLLEIKNELEAELRRVMVRTERLAVSAERNGMLKQVAPDSMPLEPSDIESYVAVHHVSRHLEHHNPLEYWKSAPYLFNFMEDYQLKRDFDEALEDERAPGIATILRRSGTALLDCSAIREYRELDPQNARLRHLLNDTLGRRAWKLLWVPPSLAYYAPEGPYADPSLSGFTKRLVFSSWNVVPRVIASVASYEAERLMIKSSDATARNTPEERKKRRPLLTFRREAGKPASMSLLGLLYPCLTLARECDPLSMALKAREPLTLADVLVQAKEKIEELLAKLPAASPGSAPDESWYWAAPVLLDMNATKDVSWWKDRHLASLWAGGEAESEPDDREAPGDELSEGTVWESHVKEVGSRLLQGSIKLGPRPSDLADVLALMAVAGPATVALRSLARISGHGSTSGFVHLEQSWMRHAAGSVAWAFRSLFNTPEAAAMIRGLDNREPFWRRVLEYCARGGLQSLMDEYAHVLRESQGLVDHPAHDVVEGVSRAMRHALSLRTATLRADDIQLTDAGLQRSEPAGLRARFALRLGDQASEDDKTLNRAADVQNAFNSPFWPFVLASTSVGQEGLDFHPWCHAVVHWNLPSNSVDMEQREGRVHRYKGHAVRRNIAGSVGLSAVTTAKRDPWESMFEAAACKRSESDTDLVPYWVYTDGDARIERHVPMLPLSREVDRLAALRRSLAVYRMVFGQPRQEELIDCLRKRVAKEELETVAAELRIDLSPGMKPTDRRGIS